MKKLLSISLAVGILFLFACSKTKYESLTVIKNCTGAYLRIDSKDYFVCNPDKIAKYDDRAQIKVAYTMCPECTTEGIKCMMAYPCNGYLKIDKVR